LGRENLASQTDTGIFGVLENAFGVRCSYPGRFRRPIKHRQFWKIEFYCIVVCHNRLLLKSFHDSQVFVNKPGIGVVGKPKGAEPPETFHLVTAPAQFPLGGKVVVVAVGAA
jgi:hypothetical protein